MLLFSRKRGQHASGVRFCADYPYLCAIFLAPRVFPIACRACVITYKCAAARGAGVAEALLRYRTLKVGMLTLMLPSQAAAIALAILEDEVQARTPLPCSHVSFYV